VERKKPDDKDRWRQAALTALGVTGGFAGYDALSHTIRDKMQEAGVPKTRSFQDFQSKLQPGDVVFHRRPSKYSGAASIGAQEFPIKESDVMIGAKGDPFYHPSVYRGKGRITEAAGAMEGVKNSRLWSKYPEEMKVYRPKAEQRVYLKRFKAELEAEKEVRSVKGTKKVATADHPLELFYKELKKLK